jgi:coproporphyrinogen III oxidase-like Fe-S oxidoreductase
MYALPGQTLDEALADLDRRSPSGAAAPLLLPPDPRTEHRLRRAAAELPESDACADMQDAIEARLAAAGFTHYETSAFARPGGNAGTTSTTGPSATTWASAPARTAN